MEFNVYINTICDYWVEKIELKSGEVYDFSNEKCTSYDFLKDFIGKDFSFIYNDGKTKKAILKSVYEEDGEPSFSYDILEEELNYE